MSDQNKALVRRGIEEIWNGEQYDRIEEFVSNDFVVHGPSTVGDIHGPNGVREYFLTMRSAFPDLRFSVIEQVAEGDRVVTHWRAEGTHAGEFQDMPPTGKPCAVTGIDIDRVVNGKIVECWTLFDQLGLVHQIQSPDQAVQAAHS